MFTKKQKTKLQPKNLLTTHYSLQTSRGFTLIELLLAMAIVAIMSGAILVSMGAQRKKANQNRLLAEFSSIMQPILMCRSDGKTISELADGNSGGTNICSEASYGKWPSLVGMDFATASGGSGYKMDSDFDSDGKWFFSASDGVVKLCCNSLSSKCHTLGAAGTCSDSDPAL